MEKMKEPTRQLLQTVVDFLNVDGEESAKLWAVLSALRGPDSEGFGIKAATTGVIRNAAGLQSLTHAEIVNKDYDNYAVIRTQLVSGHFAQHASRAFQALGLKWSEVNK